jgi:hypothetical protein
VRWHDFVEGRDPSDSGVKYEVFTREHVSGLACYLRYANWLSHMSLLHSILEIDELQASYPQSSTSFLWQGESS